MMLPTTIRNVTRWRPGVPAPVLDAVGPRLGRLKIHEPRPLPAPTPRPCAAPHLPAGAPRISVVTPSLNQGKFIGQAVSSVLGQGYPNLEYLVRDGQSTDDSLGRLNELTRRHGHRTFGPAFSVVSASDLGQAHAINLGFKATDGEIMGWLNSDDLLMPGALAAVARFFVENPSVDVVYGHRVLVDADTRCVGRWILPPHDSDVLSWADFVPQETLFWRRGLWERVGGLDETMDFAIDWDLLLRFRRVGATMVRLPRLLGMFRVHAAQKTSTSLADRGEREMMALRQRELGRYVDYAEINRAIQPYLRNHLLFDRLWQFGVAA